MKKIKYYLSAFFATIILLLNGVVAPQAYAQTSGNTLSVATYNVESPRPNDPPDETLPAVVAQHIAAIASSSSPDIWALSEVPDESAAQIYRRAAEYDGADFQLIFGTQGSNDDKLAILFNGNRLEQIGQPQQLINEVGGDRDPLVARFRSISDDQEFLVVANHFNRGSESTRNSQASGLRSWIEAQTLPVIAMGDFNMDYSVDLNFSSQRARSCRSRGPIIEGNEAFEIFTASTEIEWIRPQCLSNGTCPPLGTGCFSCFNSVLDFVFIGGPAVGDWSGTSEIGFKNDQSYCSRDPLGDTDHRPVLATLSYGGVTPPPVVINPPPIQPPSLANGLQIIELFPNPAGDSSIELISETVTIANFGNEEISLDGWQLRDRGNSTWSLFGSINPGQKIEFRRNGQPMSLNNNGDTIELVNPTGITVDEVVYTSTAQGEAIIFN